MKTTLLSLLVLFSSVSAFSQVCVDSSLIDPFGICFLIYDPVCGCDDVTYSNDCVAVKSGGNTYWIDGFVTCPDVASNCLAPARTLQSTITSSGVLLEWERPIANGAVAYRVQGRPVGATSWINGPVINAPTTQLNVPGNALMPATTYEWRVQASCAPVGVLFAPESDIKQFTTPAPRVGQAMTVAAYPNPASSNFTVIHSADKTVDVAVFDQTGRLVYSDQLDAQSGFSGYQIDVTEFPNGMYTVQIMDGTETTSTRLAVVH